MSISRKYFSWIGLLWVDLIHRSCRLYVSLPETALIHIDLFRVIDIFEINQSDQCDLISIDPLMLLCSPYIILCCSFKSTCTSIYNGSTCTSSLLSSNLVYQLLIRFYNPFHFKECYIIHGFFNQLIILSQIPATKLLNFITRYTSTIILPPFVL